MPYPPDPPAWSRADAAQDAGVLLERLALALPPDLYARVVAEPGHEPWLLVGRPSGRPCGTFVYIRHGQYVGFGWIVLGPTSGQQRAAAMLARHLVPYRG